MSKRDVRNNSIALVLVAVIVIGCWMSGVLPATINAIRYEFSRPKPQSTAPIEQQTAGAAIADLNGDTAAVLTGYEMTFPRGTVDWRVIYASRKIGVLDNAYAVIEPTYWCKMQDTRWLSCQPVISEVDAP